MNKGIGTDKFECKGQPTVTFSEAPITGLRYVTRYKDVVMPKDIVMRKPHDALQYQKNGQWFDVETVE